MGGHAGALGLIGVPAAASTVVVCWSAGGRVNVGYLGRALRWVAASAGTWTLALVLATVGAEAIGAWPSLVASIVSWLCALVGLSRLPGSPFKLAGRARTLVDGMIVSGSVLFVAWGVGFDHLYRSGGTLRLSATLVGVAVAACALVTLTRCPPAARRLLALLSASYAARAVAGAVSGYLARDAATAQLWVGVGWLLAWALAACAAWWAVRGVERDRLQPGLPTRASVFVPSVPFAAGVLAAAADGVRGELRGFLVWNAAVVIVLIVLRQILALVENISFWRDLERKIEARTDDLRRSEARFRSLVQNSSDVICVVAADGTVRYRSPSVLAVFGYDPHAAHEPPLLELVHPEDRAFVRATARELRMRSGAAATVEARLLHNDGGWRHVEATVGNLVDDDAVAGFVVNCRDITERKALEQQLTRRAFHDPLTDLANRALFADRLDQALRRASRNRRSVAVLFLDLDDFKNVNDSLGHKAGDELLAAVAARLLGCVGPEDTVARLGGDEFALLLDDVDGELSAARTAENVLDALSPPLTVSRKDVRVRGSMGIATSPAAGDSGDELLRNAEIAMYRAKARDKNGYEIFQPSMRAQIVERLDLAHDLRRAVDASDGLVVHYQPIVSLRTRRIVAVEALVRWLHPDRGLIPPGGFIELAEATGMILPLGRLVLDTACRQATLWQQRRPGAAPATVSVNLSARQLSDDGLIGDVERALNRSGLDPARLVLEITESVIIGDDETTLARLAQLRDLGLRLAIDDFGTGYSALSYLSRLPIDILKIDRSFMTAIDTRTAEAALVQTIVTMAHNLGLTPLGEGVETEAQASALQAMGCDLAQGYLFAKPLPADAIDALLTANRSLLEVDPLPGANALLDPVSRPPA